MLLLLVVVSYADPEPNRNKSVYWGSGVHSEVLKGGAIVVASVRTCWKLHPYLTVQEYEEEAAAERMWDELTTIPIFHPHVSLGRRR